LCPPEWAEPDTILDLANHAQANGFDSVWFHDHLVTPAELRHLSPRFYEPLVTMGAVAAMLPEIRVGVATIILPLRDPVLLAKQVGTLASFYPGRVFVGLGAGRYASEFDALGLDIFEQRGPTSAEALEIMQRLLTDPVVDYVGRNRTLRQVSMNPQPSPRPILLYAGNAPVAARRAARLADGWIGASMPLNDLKAMVELLAEERAKLGRDDPFTIACSATVVREGDSAPDSASDGDERLHLHAETLSGDAVRLAGLLDAYVEAGVHAFQLSFRASTLDELRDTVQWFGTEVRGRVTTARIDRT
jgi:alkanesulfonate monooxygenase SsuD/methylene tetrahydromethanopterin reductase-like flavin-dependent oxidoreductase (luciferase family)